GTSYTDTSLTEYDTNYYYTVRAYTTLNGSTYLSNYDQSGVIIHYLAVPQLTEISSTASGITVSWLKVSGATSYRLYRKTSSSKWVNIATLDSSCTSYTDTTGVSGTTYFYTVRAQSSDGMSWFDSVGISATCQ
ncbi:MAG: fibronectin type III domain-containing protein, partial [Clostridiales bacterium]|nr:fibronectin type III domain-containing protein [Clostridiales bacterium]